MVAASISSTPSRKNTLRKPSRRRPLIERRSWLRWLRSTWAPKSRSGREALRSAHTESGTSSTIATAGRGARLASATSGLRASGCTLVASTTVSWPASRRLPRCSAGRRRRHGSRSGRSRRRDQTAAEVRGEHLGRQEVPARRSWTCRSRRRRRVRRGTAPGGRSSSTGTPPSASVSPRSASSGPMPAELHRVAVAPGDPAAQAANSARGPLESGGRDGGACRPGASRTARCTRRSAW